MIIFLYITYIYIYVIYKIYIGSVQEKPTEIIFDMDWSIKSQNPLMKNLV